jgi:hypothetical protein
VIPALATPERTGRVYLGVGPEQNFTYIAALHPKLAIIVDIRRQNMIEHLLYKALFELSSDRADFVSRLFARPRPPTLDTLSTPSALFTALFNVAPSDSVYRATFAAVRDRLVATHHFPLDSADLASLHHVYETFYTGGPDIDYNYAGGVGGLAFGGGFDPLGIPRSTGRRMPSYADLMMATDSVGVARAYLATETSFRAVQSLERRNMLVPVVGNFAGPKALRAVGEYLRSHDATVAAIYTSNVEQYLFQQGDNWRRYYDNVATLPITSSSVFIRSVRPTQGGFGFGGGVRLVSQLAPVRAFLTAVHRGKIRNYSDVGAWRGQ